MYVCICNALTEHDLRQAVSEGCRSVKDLKRHTGFASECGLCAPCAKDFVGKGDSTGSSAGSRLATGSTSFPAPRLTLVRQVA